MFLCRGLIVSRLALVFVVAAIGSSSSRGDYPIQPVVANQVHVTDAFWAPRMETNRTVTIPYCFDKCEETGRIENFRVAAGKSQGPWKGSGYDDSDVSKIIEGAAYSLMTTPDPKLAAYVDGLATLYAEAQEESGYLYTMWTARATIPDPSKVHCGYGSGPFENVHQSHELYNVGHMYEGAIAFHQATGRDELLEVSKKSADHVDSVFGPGKKELPTGHQEIEIGLAKLYRQTGERRYLDLAKFFLDQRGKTSKDRSANWSTYSQDHMPVVDQTEAVGHAVRACYMYAAMADVAALTGDQSYVAAIDRIWDNVINKKLYLTGGVGAAGGHEGFAGDYELPNLTAYCETCAAIGMCLWNERMFLLHGDSKYIDVLERILYNGALSGVSLDGKTFFYPNPLESDGHVARSEWFHTSCCPTNICRFIPSVPGYTYAVRDDELYVNLYMESDAKIELAGVAVGVEQKTLYPWDGRVQLRVSPEQDGERFTVKLRIPGWARNAPVPGDLYAPVNASNAAVELLVNGEKVDYELDSGYAAIDRKWKAGDQIELRLPMEVRRMQAHDSVVQDHGLVALECGPIVYCIEGADVPDGHVVNLVIPDDAELKTEVRAELLGGVKVITGQALSARRVEDEGGQRIETSPVSFTAVPYYAWCHRQRGEMAVWLARTVAAARPLPAPTIASLSMARSSAGDPSPISDQREPESSRDHSNRFLHWWPRKGTVEWVQYEFAEPAEVSAVEVYWLDDTGIGECRPPKAWNLQYRQDGAWRDVPSPSEYGTKLDGYNRCTFTPVTTDALRLEIQLRKKFSVGLHEWKVE